MPVHPFALLRRGQRAAQCLRRGAAAPEQPGAARISRAFPAAAGTACSEGGRRRGEGEITRGAASRHILTLSLSRTHRAPVTERPRGLAFRGSRTFLGWGGGDGTALSCQAGGLRSEKAIFRGGSSGEAKRWLRTHAPVLESFSLGEIPRGSASPPQLGIPAGGRGCRPLCPHSVTTDRSLQFALPEGARVRHFLGTELIYFKFSFMFAAKAVSPHPPPLCLLPRSLAAQSRWCVFLTTAQIQTGNAWEGKLDIAIR